MPETMPAVLEESAALKEYGQRQIKEFLGRLESQRKAQRQSVPNVSADKFLWLDGLRLEDIMYFFRGFWGEKHHRDLENLAFDISEIFWFHESQIARYFLISPEDSLDPRRSYTEGLAMQKEIVQFDQRIFYKAGQQALANATALTICQKRIWDLVFIARRRHADLPSILRLVQTSSDPTAFAHKSHYHCTPEFCESANENTTAKKQLHKCSMGSCGFVEFPVNQVAKFILHGQHIAWSLCESSKGDIEVSLASVAEKNNDSDDEYASDILAISHVWSDGTGAGVERPGMVNKCLVEFFLNLAKHLKCGKIWWDTICVPMAETDEEKQARRIAISRMHKNFANAKHIVIHDEYLLQIDWAEDGSPAVALVLSPWFSRGWTALELSVSRSVKVLYRDPQNLGGYVVKDLEDDVLSHREFESLGQEAASFIIRNLLGRPRTLLDLITILSTRSTTWNRDRMAIAALLARMEDFDYDSPRAENTKRILQLYGKFRRTLLHHEQAPLVNRGPFAWCPSNLFLSPPELLKHWNPDVLLGGTPSVQLSFELDNLGSALGSWNCTVLDNRMKQRVKPVPTHLHVYRVLDELAAKYLVILHSEVAQLPDLLVIATGLWRSEEGDALYVHCHYVGYVRITLDDELTTEHMRRRRLEGLHRFSVGFREGEKILDPMPLLEKAKDDTVMVIS
ncbi:MAG: hypothetical protein Q9195_000234 [Heterodermia aff. obscurata]